MCIEFTITSKIFLNYAIGNKNVYVDMLLFIMDATMYSIT